ncbi:MAG: transposase [Burkholderiales bacterium]|nr:transposase [Burkholderiales bacterium]
MFKIPEQEYTVEFKELAVKRVKSGETARAVARVLELVKLTLRNWVKLAKAGKLHPPGARLVTPEPMELPRVRSRMHGCGWRSNHDKQLLWLHRLSRALRFKVLQIDSVKRHDRCGADESDSYSWVGYHRSSIRRGICFALKSC